VPFGDESASTSQYASFELPESSWERADEDKYYETDFGVFEP